MPSRTAAARIAPRPPRGEVILREAARLFAERGYQATTINDIGEAAGITGPGVYRHFGSKQSILLAIFEERAVYFMQRAEEILAEEAGAPIDLLQRLVDLNVAVILESRELTAAYWLEVGRLEDEERAKLAVLEQGYLEVWRTALRRLRPELAEQEVSGIADAMYWLMRSSAFYHGDLGREGFSELLTHMALGAILADLSKPKLPSAASRARLRLTGTGSCSTPPRERRRPG